MNELYLFILFIYFTNSIINNYNVQKKHDDKNRRILHRYTHCHNFIQKKWKITIITYFEFEIIVQNKIIHR